LKIKNVSNATKIGAELIIIVALEIEVIPMLQCHKIKSIVKPAEATAVYKIVYLFCTLNESLLLINKFKSTRKGSVKSIL
jgi:hypothetical protein